MHTVSTLSTVDCPTTKPSCSSIGSKYKAISHPITHKVVICVKDDQLVGRDPDREVEYT